MPNALFVTWSYLSGTTRCVQEYDEQKRRQLIESGGYTVQQMEPWLRLMHDTSDLGVEPKRRWLCTDILESQDTYSFAFFFMFVDFCSDTRAASCFG